MSQCRPEDMMVFYHERAARESSNLSPPPPKTATPAPNLIGEPVANFPTGISHLNRIQRPPADPALCEFFLAEY